MEGFKKENFGMSILNVLNKVSVLSAKKTIYSDILVLTYYI